MFHDTISRRNFMAGLGVAGTAAGASPDAVVVPNYPLTETKPSGAPIRIVCAEHLTTEELEKIRAAGKNVDLVMLRDRSELKSKAADAECILGVVDRETMLNAKKLKWVQTWAAGVEVLPKELMEHPCALTNMQRVFAPVIAESALGLLLSLTRGLAQNSIPALREHQMVYSRECSPRRPLWQDPGPGRAGWNRHGNRAPRPLWIQHENPRGRPEALAQAGIRGRAARARLVDGDGAAGRRADERGPAHKRNQTDVQRVQSFAR